MRKIGRLGWLLVLLLLPAGVHAQQAIHWQPTLESAKRAASQTNRLVLIHFWAPWCEVCGRMEAEVLNRPEVAAALEVNYVPVKINADHFPATARQYGVTAVPATVVIMPTPEGERVEIFRGRLEAAQYVAGLDRLATDVRTRQRQAYVQIPAGPPAFPAQTAAVPPGVAGGVWPPGEPQTGISPPAVPPAPPSVPQYSDDRYADYFARTGPPTSPATPPQPAPPAVAPAGNPPLGLDGFCPVELSEKADWVPGDRRFGRIHRGRTYLFAGPEQLGRFLADPDRYAPVLSGDDVVLAVEQGRSVAGRREHGVFFGNRIYLFADEASLQRFSDDRDRYANEALRAMRAALPPGPQWR